MLSTISPFIAPLLVFGLVVFVHELGHFVAAKLTGVYAPVFSLGWGRRLFGWRRGETATTSSRRPLMLLQSSPVMSPHFALARPDISVQLPSMVSQFMMVSFPDG